MKWMIIRVLFFALMVVMWPLSTFAQGFSADDWALVESERMAQEGWKVAPGLVPIALQLKESYEMALAKDENGYPKYFMGEALTTGTDYNVALSQAATLAKLDMAGKIQSEIMGQVEANATDSELLAQAAVSCRQTFSQRIGRVVAPINVYRHLDNGKMQVRTVIYYAHEQALEIYKQTLREALEQKAEALGKELDGLLDL